MKIDANPDIERLLIAGRRAAYGELLSLAKERGLTITGDTEEEYRGCGGFIGVGGLNILPVIDATILEVVVQVGPRHAPRPWWKFWA